MDESIPEPERFDLPLGHRIVGIVDLGLTRVVVGRSQGDSGTVSLLTRPPVDIDGPGVATDDIIVIDRARAIEIAMLILDAASPADVRALLPDHDDGASVNRVQRVVLDVAFVGGYHDVPAEWQWPDIIDGDAVVVAASKSHGR